MKNKKIIKTRVLNLIILDKSGSMKNIRNAIVEGLNAYFGEIRLLQEIHESTLEYYVTLILFGGKRIRIVYDEVPITEIQNFLSSQYKPYGMTCLYDALGLALCRTEIHVEKSIDTIVKVSIVSDGLDNSSEEYSSERLRSNIRDLCEKGWEFCLVTNKENTKRAASEIGINQVYSYSCDDKEAKGVISFLSQFLFSLKKVTNKSL